MKNKKCLVKPGQDYWSLIAYIGDEECDIATSKGHRPKGDTSKTDDLYTINCFTSEPKAVAAKKKILRILEGH